MQPWSPPVPDVKPPHVKFSSSTDLTANFKRLLASPNICSKRWIFEQYDSMVQSNTVEGPGADAGLMRIKPPQHAQNPTRVPGTPSGASSQRALAMALDGNGRWCWLAPKLGAMHAVAEAARNVSCTGATPLAATNCLNFGNPEKPQIMGQFSEVVDGVAAACEALETPITGGNVSLYNETLGEGIYPTPVIGVVGMIENVGDAMTFHFRQPDRDVFLLSGGAPADAARSETEFGSSEYAKEILGGVWGTPPALDLGQEAALQKCVRELILADDVESVHDCSDGGLAVALAESAFPKVVGAEIDLNSTSALAEAVLFGEDATRVVISCDPKKSESIKRMAVKWGLRAKRIGRTIPEKLVIKVDGTIAVSAGVSELRQVWDTALLRALHAETPEHLVPEVLQKS